MWSFMKSGILTKFIRLRCKMNSEMRQKVRVYTENILKTDPSFKIFNESKYFDFINVLCGFRLSHGQIFKMDVSLYADKLNILETA